MLSSQPLVSVSEQITAELRNELLSGCYTAGTPLREVALAERFGVSRAPIRKVLQQLVQEGLLSGKRNCGVTVAPPPPQAVRELLLPMRARIESYALEQCYDDLTDDDFCRWQAILNRLRLACEERDSVGMLGRDSDFHRFILLRSGQGDLLPIWTPIMARTQVYREEGNRAHLDPMAVHGIHAALFDVFRAGNRRAALEALVEHVVDGPFNENCRRRWYARSAGT